MAADIALTVTDEPIEVAVTDNPITPSVSAAPGPPGADGADGADATVSAADEAARLALTPEPGDLVWQIDTNELYVHDGTGWLEIRSGDPFLGDSLFIPSPTLATNSGMEDGAAQVLAAHVFPPSWTTFDAHIVWGNYAPPTIAGNVRLILNAATYNDGDPLLPAPQVGALTDPVDTGVIHVRGVATDLIADAGGMKSMQYGRDESHAEDTASLTVAGLFGLLLTRAS